MRAGQGGGRTGHENSRICDLNRFSGCWLGIIGTRPASQGGHAASHGQPQFSRAVRRELGHPRQWLVLQLWRPGRAALWRVRSECRGHLWLWRPAWLSQYHGKSGIQHDVQRPNADGHRSQWRHGGVLRSNGAAVCHRRDSGRGWPAAGVWLGARGATFATLGGGSNGRHKGIACRGSPSGGRWCGKDPVQPSAAN